MAEISENGFVDVTITSSMFSRLNYIGIDVLNVYMYIHSRINIQQFQATGVKESWPGINDIAKNVKMRKSNVIRAINKLEYLDYLSVGRGFKKVSHYFIMPGIENDKIFLVRYHQWYKQQLEKDLQASKRKRTVQKSPFVAPISPPKPEKSGSLGNQ